jgi:hypothetical protein
MKKFKIAVAFCLLGFLYFRSGNHQRKGTVSRPKPLSGVTVTVSETVLARPRIKMVRFK